MKDSRTALEQLRETINFLCDSRRSITAIRSELPDIDYSHVIHDEDFLWASYEKEHGLQEEYGGLRETKDLGALRARAAVNGLLMSSSTTSTPRPRAISTLPSDEPEST